MVLAAVFLGYNLKIGQFIFKNELKKNLLILQNK